MNNYIIMGIGLLIILFVLFMLIRFCDNFREEAYKCFLFAEKEIGKGKKMDYVVEHIYNYLPAPCRILPQSFYRKLLQKMFDEVKDLLDDGHMNNSIK